MRRKKFTFLLHNAYAVGGTVRTTLNLASALADAGHSVEIASLNRHRETPRFATDPRVRLVPLVDLRDGAADRGSPQFAEPARDFPAADRRHAQYTRLHDLRVREHLIASRSDVVIGTRPGLNVYVALFGRRGALRLAQEHLRLEAHSAKLRAVLARHYRGLDAVITTTEADAAAYRARMRLPGVRIAAVPNIVPCRGLAAPDQPEPVIAAAGRLVPGKRFDLLIGAFAPVAAKHPAWTLRIYGGGPEKARLRQLIQDLELVGRVRLMGTRSPIEEEFARAALVVSSSDAESFGMTLVEAMRCRVPVISTDCPLGPAEIIHDGIDGCLVPKGDPRALTDAMLGLIGNEPRRRLMADAAQVSARRYDPGRIVAHYARLLAALPPHPALRALRRAAASAAHRARAARRSARAALRARTAVRTSTR
ncbi:glycosyltransferase family 4 protein [Streptomyces iconiensis]|uniref:D-inositol 3-phosphate glycosyltransferase n=1 Tax=Streptomyces iconiensis TaxID=1384038 RepID=A0ABT6ZR68_9ACTN|nr:glycosyltransferase family 4 protein [Streptomyces iconiensis]MDJ1131545.1 glycosyltransferase family 4 protein [Streptomyces iconiensis]